MRVGPESRMTMSLSEKRRDGKRRLSKTMSGVVPPPASKCWEPPEGEEARKECRLHSSPVLWEELGPARKSSFLVLSH